MSEADITEAPTEEEKAEEVPEEAVPEKPKRGRPKLPSDERKERKKAANKSYYEGIREKLKQAKESPPKPVKSKKKPSPIQESPPKKPKTRKKRVTPESPPKKVKPKRKPEPEYEPTSPRSKLVAAYREARLHQQEQKIQRYRSWFE